MQEKQLNHTLTTSKMTPVLLSILMLFLLIGGTLLPIIRPTSIQAQTNQSKPLNSEKAPLPNNLVASGIVPTIQVSPSHGYAGQPVQVSGTGDTAFTNVRLAWWYGEATETVAIAPLAGNGTYYEELTVPLEANSGSAQLCVVHDGLENIPFVCTNFTIDTAPSGRVEGQIALSNSTQPVDAHITLYDSESTALATASIQSDGSFLTPDLPPGKYEAVFSGAMPAIVESQYVQVLPGQGTVISPNTITVPCNVTDVGTVSSIMVNPGVQQPSLYLPSAGKLVGTYLSLGASGPSVMVSFTPIIQTTPSVTIQRVEFYLKYPNGDEILFATDTTGPIWQAAYNVSLLPPGYNTVIVRAFAQQGCIKENRIRLVMLPSPIDDPSLRGAQISFDYVAKQYNFSATFINAPGILPITYPDPAPSLPLIGTVENRMDVGIPFAGNMKMNGDINLTMFRSDAFVRLLGVDLYNKSEVWLNKSVPLGNDYQAAKYQAPTLNLAKFDKKIPVYSGPVATFLGIVTVNASISVGFNGYINLYATLRPMEPDLDLVLAPHAGANLPISLKLLFLGFGIASLTGTTEVALDVPVVIHADEASPVYIDDPCLRLRFWLDVWIGIDYYVGSATLYDDTYDIFQDSWGNCPALAAALAVQSNNKPRIMAEPTVVSGPGGAMFTVYVEDSTPTMEMITPVIMGRFWNNESVSWNEPFALSDGQHYVSDPAATFMGTDGRMLVVWTQNMLTRSEMADLGTDLNAIFAHQEIFFNYFDGSVWSGPTQVTNDNLPDGFAAIAGDESGGATLVWTVDTDGDLATRTDLEIAAADWAAGLQVQGGKTAVSNAWGMVNTISDFDLGLTAANADTAMDVQPMIIRPGDTELTEAIAWTRDLDGEPATNGDRILVVARLVGDVWTYDVPAALPPGADSPTLGWDSDQNILYLAFLVRGKDSDGVTDTGVGDQAVLWQGEWIAGGGWQNVGPLLDEDDELVRGEDPRIQVRPDQEALLLFRRFDSADSPGQYGNLALSQRTLGTQFGSPMYLLPDASQNWMQSMAIDTSGQAMIVEVERVFPNAATQAPLPASVVPSARMEVVSAAADPVHSLLLRPGGDPAVEPELTLSQVHAGMGETVVITAVIRNVGRAAATDIAVQLFSGVPGNGTLVDTIVIPGPLAFNEAEAVAFDIVATGGPQSIYVDLTTSGDDISQENNVATADLAAMPAPTLISINDNKVNPNSLQVVWQPLTIAGVAGYRILRSENAGGPYSLVGQSVGNMYVD
ncbi:MAG: hypothetical protein KC441_10050, partial [Anaerolineales bacterium]|nr:hypothetical protein [Anaerolineales bacterium]